MLEVVLLWLLTRYTVASSEIITICFLPCHWDNRMINRAGPNDLEFSVCFGADQKFYFLEFVLLDGSEQWYWPIISGDPPIYRAYF